MFDRKTTLAALLLGSAAIANVQLGQAAEPPSPAEVRNVLNYYYSGESATPVLADFKLCSGIHRDGLLKNECTEEITAERLKPGETVYAWMNFMVPKGKRGRVLMQFKHAGVTRDTSKFAIRGSVRYRTWQRIRLHRTGEWEVPIWFENDAGMQEIERLTIRVGEPPLQDSAAAEPVPTTITVDADLTTSQAASIAPAADNLLAGH